MIRLSSPPRRWSCALVLACSIGMAGVRPLGAQGAGAAAYNPKEILQTESYVKPPAVVERIVAAPRTDNITFTNPSPDHKWFMKTQTDGLGSLTDFGKGHIYLGGLQVDTLAFRARALTTRGGRGIVLIDPATGKTHTLETAPGAGVSGATWSPDGKSIAYIANLNTSSQIFVIDVATGKEVQITTTPLNAVHVQTFDWTADGKSIVTVLVPTPRKPAPPEPAVAPSPIVRLTEPGVDDKERIHPSLLFDTHDKDLLEYYSTGQLAVIDVKTHVIKKIGQPAMIRAVSPSPDGQYFRVTLVDKPFSYIVPFSSFGSLTQLWDNTGKVVAELGKQPLRLGSGPDTTGADTTRVDSTLSGRASAYWNPVGPGMLYLVADRPPVDTSAAGRAAAANGANGRGAGRGAGGRGAGGGGAGGGRGGRGGGGFGGGGAGGAGHLVNWLPPYGTKDTTVLYSTSSPISAAVYSPDAKTLFISSANQVYAVRMADTAKRIPIRYATLTGGGAGGGRGGRGGGGGGGGGRGGRGGGGGGPDSTQVGAIATKRGPNGGAVVALASDNATVFLSGNRSAGANWETEGPRAWVDKVNIETGARVRLFNAQANEFDTFVAPLDDDYSKFIVARESPTMVSDSYLMTAGSPLSAATKLTNNVDYAPEVTHDIRKRLWATRPDGFKFEVDVTLPADYKEGTKLPGLIWFYPTEVSSQQAYDQGREGTNVERFPAVGARSPEIWTTQGYVVIQPQAIPVFGPQGTMNDHYVDELRDGLYATIQVVKDAGYLDANRVGLWGHSYGAFSTVNAMVHTTWFKAGIAGDGMYNRSLTPYGFQNERRDFWQAQDVYEQMSPFFYAPQLSGALLMYHSLEDQNEGTDPISSIRMFHALLGQGKTAALFMYPYEDHGPATRESDLDQWARWIAWFDVYVKNATTGPLNDNQPTATQQGRGRGGG